VKAQVKADVKTTVETPVTGPMKGLIYVIKTAWCLIHPCVFLLFWYTVFILTFDFVLSFKVSAQYFINNKS
jgi:hypothetical protein